MSTYLDGQLGGLHGRTLRAGDVLSQDDSQDHHECLKAATGQHQHLCTPPTALRFTRGPQQEYFGEAGYRAFISQEYRVSPRSNRVGYRIAGSCPPMLAVPRTKDTGAGPSDIIEEGNPVGGIQVAGGQEIICLGRDCGTSGAYAKIGCLISTDVSRLAQLAPGRHLRFTEVTVAQARQIRADYEAVLSTISTPNGEENAMPITQTAASQTGATS
jgi:antagonist of KipI